MKKLLTIFTILITATVLKADRLDSLRNQLKITQNDSLKAPIYAQLAEVYLHYDTVSNRVKKMMYQNEAIINSYQGLRLFSKYSDTTGMRICFDNLGKVYHAQQRYSQAKWYVLQSNNLSRLTNDVPNIINSLVKLAAIKTEIKDYALAKQDLDEAMALSASNNLVIKKAVIQKSYAKLNAKLKKKGKVTVLASKKSATKVQKVKTLAKVVPVKSKTKLTAVQKSVIIDTTKKLVVI